MYSQMLVEAFENLQREIEGTEIGIAVVLTFRGGGGRVVTHTVNQPDEAVLLDLWGLEEQDRQQEGQ